MEPLFNSTLFILILVFVAYSIGVQLFRVTKLSIFNPVLVAVVVVIALLYILDIEYESFRKGSEILDFMLGPSVVAIGYVLYEQMDRIKDRLLSIVVSVSVGAFVGVASVIILCRLLGCDDVIAHSMQPKSVTAPIALSLSKQLGGVSSVTVVAVIIAGISGSVIAPSLLKLFGVNNPIAKGLAMGSAAHGIGTARALQIGAIEGAVSGLAIGLMGVATSLVIPLCEIVFGR